ncbi:transaldolase family protein [Chloroflexota bacterium]
MIIFLDTANIDEIREMAELGIIDGVTTNPSLMAKVGRTDYREVVQEVCYLVQGPVSAEVISTEAEGMVEEATKIIQWSPHVVVKIPFVMEGLKALRSLRDRHAEPAAICEACLWQGRCGTPIDRARDIVTKEPIRFNVTLVFSANQALLAAKAGATYISPFVGRLDDAGSEGMQVVDDIRTILDNFGFDAKIITSSTRHPIHLTQAAVIGSDVVTLPYGVLKSAITHPLTDIGLARFVADWEATEKGG